VNKIWDADKCGIKRHSQSLLNKFFLLSCGFGTDFADCLVRVVGLAGCWKTETGKEAFNGLNFSCWPGGNTGESF